MSITTDIELEGIQRASEAVAETLFRMRQFAKPGISTKELDDFGGSLLHEFGATSAPWLAYKFPGNTCISLNNEIAHGIPSGSKIIREGDLINIDVSAELNGFWSDNGCSFVVGRDSRHFSMLVNTSRNILLKAIREVRDGLLFSDLGFLIEKEARLRGYKVIRNLAGHGIGRQLHEYPQHILNFCDKSIKGKFRKNMVVAIETFISTSSDYATSMKDGWTLKGNKGGFVAQHEHTVMVTESAPIILTASNGI